MKRKITISSSYSGVLPVASFANARPGFSAQEEFEIEYSDKQELNLIIEERQRELMAICLQNYVIEADKARIQKIKNDLKNFRFYPVDGEEFPSVTSVQNYDKTFECTDEELRQYCSQGNIYDAEVRNYIKTGVFKPSQELLECTADRHIIKTGSLQLSLDPCKIVEFLEKYPIKNLRVHETPLINRRYRYAGVPDLLGKYDGLETLVSIKRTKNPKENFVQESAYSKCEGMEKVKQALVIELKAEADGGNKSGFSKPSITTELDKYFELFLYRRNQVKTIYGV